MYLLGPAAQDPRVRSLLASMEVKMLSKQWSTDTLQKGAEFTSAIDQMLRDPNVGQDELIRKLQEPSLVYLKWVYIGYHSKYMSAI